VNLFLTCRRMTCAGFTVALLAGVAYADQPPGIPRIGVLMPPVTSMEEGLRQGLRELGYIEGKSIVIEWRRSTGTREELQLLAADLIRSKVELIVTAGTAATSAAMETTTTVPVLFHVGNPVASGFAASLARPGGNGTGVSVISAELTPKRLELLHLLVRRAKRIVYLRNPSNPMAQQLLDEVQKAALILGLRVETLDARNVPEIDAALDKLRRSAANGCLVGGDLLYLAEKARISRAIRENRMPAVFAYREFHEDGALMSYGPSLKATMRSVAPYVDKILKGAKPADLPIEQISKFQLVIDLRVAREMGITVPQELLFRADEVIR
jgi:putative tryptophan/tyrosine transport system substrate-binding protein